MSEYIKKLRVIDADGNPQDKQIDYEALANKPELVGQKYNNGSGEIFNDYENNIASMPYTHVEGSNNEASGAYAHVEGSNNKATHYGTHAEGANNTVSAPYAHVEGWTNTASGLCAHAGGRDSIAAGTGSFAHGLGVNAQGEAATVFGKYNDNEGDYIFTIGNGDNASARRNALTLNKNGNLEVAGDISFKGSLCTTTSSLPEDENYLYISDNNISAYAYRYDSGEYLGTLGIDAADVDIHGRLNVYEELSASKSIQARDFKTRSMYMGEFKDSGDKQYDYIQSSSSNGLQVDVGNEFRINCAPHEGDYIFTVGNGSSAGARSNALTLNKNGNLNIQNNIYTNIGSIQDESDYRDLLDYHRVLNYNDLLDILTSLIHIGDSAPSNWDRSNYGKGMRAYPLLWIDTSSETGGLKYLDNNEQWRHVPVAYTE